MYSIKKQFLLSTLFIIAALGVSILLYLSKPEAKIEEPEYRPISVDVATAVKQTIRLQIQAQGNVSPLRKTTIMSEVSGRIVQTDDKFIVGGFVAKDDILLRIDPRDYQTDLLRAQAALASAQSTLVQEKGRAQVAQREWEKLPANSQRSQEARDLYLRKPQLELAEAQLLAAQADLDTAKDRLDRTVIKAPYDALIRAKHAELGQFVTTGSQLAEIFSVDIAEVRLPIPQSRLEYLELPGIEGYEAGTHIDLYTDISGELSHWSAELNRTEGIFDERSRVLYAVARIEDPFGLKRNGKEPLRPGTFVTADIQGKELNNIVALPRHILRAGNNVWVVDDEQSLRNRNVTVLRTGGDRLLVSGGLDEGDRVSLTAVDSSLNGAKVTIKSNTPSDQLELMPVTPETTEIATTEAAPL